jgi:pyruvate carboxylase subunit B
MSDVVRRGGFGTSVTPVSQFYFQQAFNNVMFGPWEKIAPPYGRMVLGYFGKTPVPPDEEVVKLAAEQLKEEPTTQSPLEMNDADPTKGVAAARTILEENNLPISDENIFIVAACKEKGLAFLKGEADLGVRKVQPDAETPAAAPAAAPAQPVAAGGAAEYTVTVNGKDFHLAFEGNSVVVDGNLYQVDLKSAGASKAEAPAAKPSAAPSAAGGDLTAVKAQMPGVVLRVLVANGDRVAKGDQLLVLEAMKMEVPVASPVAGAVTDICVSQGDHVANNQQLLSVRA